MIKTPNKLGIEGNFFKLIESKKNPKVTSYLMGGGGRSGGFPSKSGTRKVPLLPHLFNIVMEVLDRAIYQLKEIKDIYRLERNE